MEISFITVIRGEVYSCNNSDMLRKPRFHYNEHSMRLLRTALFLSAIMLAASGFAQEPGSPARAGFGFARDGVEVNRTWITDVTIISPENLDHIGTGSVLIENGRIARVDRGPAPKKPAGATL